MVGSISRLLAVVVRDGRVHGRRLAHAGAFAADLRKIPGLDLAAEFLKDAKQLRVVRPAGGSLSLPPRLSGFFFFTATTFEQDVLGALGSGMAAVWLNRYRLTCPDPELVIEIRGLEPVGDILEGLGVRAGGG